MGTPDRISARSSASVAPSDEPDLECTPERFIVDLRASAPFVSLGRYRYLAAHDPLPMQRHSALLVFAAPLRGRFDVVVDEHVVAVDRGEVICIRPGSRYSIGIGAQPRGELLWFALTTADSGTDTDLARVIRDVMASETSVWGASQTSIDLLHRVIDGPSDAEWLTLAWRRTLCTTALTEFALGLQDKRFDAAAVHPGVRRALRWVDEHIDEPVSVANLVSASRMSTAHFYQQFTQTLGTSPKDYVLRTKITRAQELLRKPGSTVTAVAYALGFSSSQHFSTAFRRYAGTTPSEYREWLPPE